MSSLLTQKLDKTNRKTMTKKYKILKPHFFWNGGETVTQEEYLKCSTSQGVTANIEHGLIKEIKIQRVRLEGGPFSFIKIAISEDSEAYDEQFSVEEIQLMEDALNGKLVRKEENWTEEEINAYVKYRKSAARNNHIDILSPLQWKAENSKLTVMTFDVKEEEKGRMKESTEELIQYIYDNWKNYHQFEGKSEKEMKDHFRSQNRAYIEAAVVEINKQKLDRAGLRI